MRRRGLGGGRVQVDVVALAVKGAAARDAKGHPAAEAVVVLRHLLEQLAEAGGRVVQAVLLARRDRVGEHVPRLGGVAHKFRVHQRAAGEKVDLVPGFAVVDHRVEARSGVLALVSVTRLQKDVGERLLAIQVAYGDGCGVVRRAGRARRGGGAAGGG